MQTQNNFSLLETCRRIFSLAVPMAGTQLISVASNFLCMAMLAHLGHQVLAASALIYSTQICIMVTGMSILFSLSVLVGHANGAKKYFSIGNYVQQGWTLSFLISIPIIFIFWNIGSLLLFFGQKPIIAQIVQTFFHAFSWGVIPGMLSTCNQQFGYGVHKKGLILSTSILSVFVLLIASYAFIFGKFGMPALGVAGLGYATAIQYLFYFIFTSLFFYFGKSFKKYELFRYRVHKNMEDFAQMFRIGWPIAVQIGGEVSSLFVAGLLIGWLGTQSLAASQIVNQYYFLAFIPLFSFSQASGILVGQANGSKQFHEIKKLGFASMALVLFVTLLVASIFIIFPKSLASLYMNIHSSANSEVLRLTILLFLVDAFALIFDGLRNVLIGVMRGLFDTKFPMYVNLFVIWCIGMPLAYVLAFPLHQGVVGIALGSLFGMTLGAAIMVYRWNSLNKLRP